MKAYSMDLRTRVLADCDAGLATKPVAEKYGVSRTWVRSLKQRRRETGEIAARVGGGRNQAQQMSKQAREERMALAFQSVAMVSMAVVGATAAVHLIRELLRRRDGRGRER